MRSYHSHVEHLLSGPQKTITHKPCFRSSAIFPVEQREGIRTRLIFMGYWFLKRKVKEITLLVTLRSAKGDIITRTMQTICDSKAYRVELGDLLEIAEHPEGEDFFGSIEVEFFSHIDLMFPYPAVVVNYYGPQFSSVVHTAQRIYNDFEDRDSNSVQLVPESGFNIYAQGDLEPFFYLVNGCEEVPDCILDMEFYNSKQETLHHSLSLGRLGPYETRSVFPRKEVDLESFLGGEVGAAKIRFQLNWIYPRLIAGNLHRDLPGNVITHTYYDCTDAATKDDYWKEGQEGWYPASLNVPVSVEGERFTNAYFYPLLSPTDLDVDAEVYDAGGQLLGRKEEVLEIISPCEQSQHIDFKALCEDLDIDPSAASSARIIARPREGSQLPARIKLGYDLGISQTALPCNICTNLWPFNPSLEKKPMTFRWGPVLADRGEATMWLLNGSAFVDYQREAVIHVLFHREKDTQMIERTVTLPANGSYELRLSEDQELLDFFEGKIGWYTATSTNPYITSYYFCEHSSGIVGGDHGF